MPSVTIKDYNISKLADLMEPGSGKKYLSEITRLESGQGSAMQSINDSQRIATHYNQTGSAHDRAQGRGNIQASAQMDKAHAFSSFEDAIKGARSEIISKFVEQTIGEPDLDLTEALSDNLGDLDFKKHPIIQGVINLKKESDKAIGDISKKVGIKRGETLTEAAIDQKFGEKKPELAAKYKETLQAAEKINENMPEFGLRTMSLIRPDRTFDFAIDEQTQKPINILQVLQQNQQELRAVRNEAKKLEPSRAARVKKSMSKIIPKGIRQVFKKNLASAGKKTNTGPAQDPRSVQGVNKGHGGLG